MRGPSENYHLTQPVPLVLPLKLFPSVGFDFLGGQLLENHST